MSNENTQLINVNNYNPKQNIVFSKPISGEVPGTKPKIEFKRINIFTKNEDGTEGELVIPTNRLYSYGVSENVNPETKKITGYTFPLCLWSRDEPTEEEEKWLNNFNEIVDCCIDHLIENKDKIEKYDLERKDLEKIKGGLNPLYWKMVKITDANNKTYMQKAEGKGPTLYAKLMHSRRENRYLTKFYNMKTDEVIEYTDLLNKRCRTECAIKIESIFIGAKIISLQVKLYEAYIEPQIEVKKLMRKPKYDEEVAISEAKSSAELIEELSIKSDIDSDDDGILM